MALTGNYTKIMKYITRKDVIERVERLLGKEHLLFYTEHYYVTFDKYTENVMILDKFPLHDFLYNNRDNIPTRVNLKLLADVHNIQLEYGGMFKIGATFLLPHDKLKVEEDHMCIRYHKEGNALDIIPLTDTYIKTRELHKACRRAKKVGGRIIYEDHIHLDAMLSRHGEPWKEGRIKPPPPPEWEQWSGDEGDDWIG